MFFRIEFQDVDGTKRKSEFFWLPPNEKDLRSIYGKGVGYSNGKLLIFVTGYNPVNAEPKQWGDKYGIASDLVTTERDYKNNISKYMLLVK